MRINNLGLFSLLALFLTVGFIVGQATSAILTPVKKEDVSILRQPGKFTAPLLRVDIPPEKDEKTIALKKKLEDYISQSKNNNLAANISVYFRNQKHYRWFALNDEEKYNPASLMKIVILISYLKKAETEPDILNKQILFAGPKDTIGYNFPPQKDIEIGKSYSVAELLEFMISYSSNDAKNLLIKDLDTSYLNHVLEDLQLELINYQENDNFMSVSNFASFFRTLYNASYLNSQMSEKALEILSKSDFKEGLVADLPSNIPVAHKFGERYDTYNEIRQLHDCGMIYFSDNHYLLCVMTRGKSFTDLKKIIQTISLITFQEVNNWGAN